MCGICGVVGGDARVELAAVRRMAASIAHRGPDDEGFHADEDAVLGNRRLQIIDLEGGHQPLSNEDGTVWVTFNGEIYNFRELRHDLIRAGHRFRTATDTEVLVHLWEEEGPRFVERLRGMFAFALWDARRRLLFAARDRFGQKPFFYTLQDGRFLFASEVKALLLHPTVTAEPEPAAIDYYLTFRFVPPPLTMFREIRKLPAGHRLVWREGRVEVEPYWEPDFREEGRRSDSSWMEELEWRIRDAVRSHLVSDVPVGALLSGGLDSSIVVAMMSRELSAPVPTFCIGSDALTFDERRFARRVAVHCRTEHRERVATAAELHNVSDIVRQLDEPSDPIAACVYEAARLAAAHVKVVLGGDGGDEMFAGFDRFAAFRWVGWYGRLPRRVREEVVWPAVERWHKSFGYKSLAEKVRWVASVGGEQSGVRYARMSSYFRFGPRERERIYGAGLREALRDRRAEDAVVRPFEEAPARDLLHRMLYADLVTRLPEHTLMLTDRLSMAHGLETRAPLLDHELADFCATMPARLKVRRGVTKYALRRVARAYLPGGIVRRPKQGFQFPVAEWFDEEALGEIRRTLTSGPLVRREWIRPEMLEELFREHLARRVDHHVRIWLLQSLDAWSRIYLERESTDAVEAPLAEQSAR